jgi:DNA-binding PadR family transcriptional regulator
MKKELFIDGVPELLLLRLLAQNEMYGYELVAKIHSISGRRL